MPAKARDFFDPARSGNDVESKRFVEFSRRRRVKKGPLAAQIEVLRWLLLIMIFCWLHQIRPSLTGHYWLVIIKKKTASGEGGLIPSNNSAKGGSPAEEPHILRCASTPAPCILLLKEKSVKQKNHYFHRFYKIFSPASRRARFNPPHKGPVCECNLLWYRVLNTSPTLLLRRRVGGGYSCWICQ